MARRRGTYADIEALPEHLVGELIEGELFMSPRPRPSHAIASTRLTALLDPPFGFARGGPGGWWIVDEPEVHLSRDVLVPDLAGWRRERMPSPPETAFFPLAPDWICEVLSPSTAHMDRTRKVGVYGRERVPWLWLLDPDARTLEVLRLDGEGYRLHAVHGDAATARVEPFEAVELELELLWPTFRGEPER